VSDDLDITQPIREGLMADAGIVTALPVYGGNGRTIFSRRPVPSDAPYPMIVISPDAPTPLLLFATMHPQTHAMQLL
jgi:hypothetical protein